MSSIKNPEEKKRLSLKHDRRNVYGENAKASRKGIPRSKRTSSKVARAAVAQVLVNQIGPSMDLDLDTAEDLVKARTIEKRRKGFKKSPDVPLVKVLLGKKSGKPAWREPLPWLAPKGIDRLRKNLRD